MCSKIMRQKSVSFSVSLFFAQVIWSAKILDVKYNICRKKAVKKMLEYYVNIGAVYFVLIDFRCMLKTLLKVLKTLK